MIKPEAYERWELDVLASGSHLPSVIKETEDELLVNGMLGQYVLWVPKADRSVGPCLTGEIGGMIGAWENWVTSWHTKNLHNYDTYIDVGANCGYFSFLANYFGLSVIAIEANPQYAGLLTRTIEENDADNVAVVNAAVSESEGMAMLKVPETLHGGASITDNHIEASHHYSVKTITLDDLQGPAGDRVLVKMDIEGAEEMAFKGATEFNQVVKPTYILEYTPRHYTENFFDALSSYGEVTMVDSNGNETSVTKHEAEGASDWITLVVRPRSEDDA